MLVITEGFDKGLDLTPLIDALDGARHVIVTGTTAERTVEAIDGRWPVSRADSMHDAVKRAEQLATEGDVVILSPAASSFDAYQSYAHRGDVFKGPSGSFLEALVFVHAGDHLSFLNGGPFSNTDFGNRSIGWCLNGHFHLHRFQDHHDLFFFNLIANGRFQSSKLCL